MTKKERKHCDRLLIKYATHNVVSGSILHVFVYIKITKKRYFCCWTNPNTLFSFT